MSSRTGYGQRRIHVTPEAFEGWLVRGSMIKTSLPDDARFVRLYPQKNGSAYVLIFESEKWDELAEGQPIPRADIKIKDSSLTFEIQ